MPNEAKWGIALLAGAGIIALGWKVPVLLTVFHVMICLLLVVVLMQSGKAADLAGAFGGSGSQTAFGPRGAANLLTRVTTWCFVMFLFTTITMTLRQNLVHPTGSSVFDTTQPAKTQQPAPGTPAPAPQTPPPQSQPQQQPPQQPPPQPPK